ncbi:sigma-70 family RNA polymerase sigma factor [Paenibacillus macerans]|uniref:RNA polymerase sigma factor n=1 Tax=Paenibacillus macerans TaxID=44252 RepID=UPI000689A028|nr:sigma-70 family RNA polymerase sigma factor [Paenibacillus macerans]MEC0136042.1 sigma-70 family RNA polymerase sigma factor [Paenibacillus macerans]GIP08898.1 ECF RNA polymerase sigma factor SigW [Paenibacillus macerans]
MDRPHLAFKVDPEQIEMLVRRTKCGDKGAFAEIIQRFEKPIYIYCYHMLKSKEEAEDALQEIFIKAYEQIHQYRPAVSFSAWLYKIAYNYSLNQIRGKKRWYRFLTRYKHERPSCQNTESLVLLKDLLSSLTEEEKHILLLRAIHRYSFNEISEIMSIKSATVRKKYERLRRKLSEEDMNEGGEANAAIAKST